MALNSSANSNSKSEKPLSLIWGCELNHEKQTYTFKIPDEWKYEQQLALRTICLGEKAKDEFNVVEIVPSEDSQDTTPVPLATLKPSVLPMATMVGVELTPPVTFRLRAGSGPVYITGQHVTLVPDLSWDEEEEEEEEEEEKEVAEEEESQEDSLPKAIKHPASNKRGSIAKKKKMEKEEENSSVPSDDDVIPSKGRGVGRGRKPAVKK
ncbi:nucleoplasmin-2 isoform X1 [Mauremys mutica]|uniref:nucleoplasmin-2 isoform X1 n=1 Tax=Mauremys mutica TaxID=74926 RepID=UPI001D165781|nr:nucleoplasmin-2 isoform X1 [Mauremys mutica]XP_044859300.1 nucleoplasmin-2 isoform X1 [Mauremys mutica]XP_044859301.1 nucleoplasmin-2 isoform X1 [Mauremys mutica]